MGDGVVSILSAEFLSFTVSVLVKEPIDTPCSSERPRRAAPQAAAAPSDTGPLELQGSVLTCSAHTRVHATHTGRVSYKTPPIVRQASIGTEGHVPECPVPWESPPSPRLMPSPPTTAHRVHTFSVPPYYRVPVKYFVCYSTGTLVFFQF